MKFRNISNKGCNVGTKLYQHNNHQLRKSEHQNKQRNAAAVEEQATKHGGQKHVTYIRKALTQVSTTYLRT